MGFAGMAGLGAAVAACLYWAFHASRDDPGLAGAAVKTLSTGLLALILWQAGGPGLLWVMAAGMLLGAIGDWCLARRGEAAFLAGMAAFGAGHLAYAGALLAKGAGLGFDGLIFAEGAALAALLAAALSTEVWLAPRTGALRWPVRAYVLLIAVMGAAAVLLPAAPGQGTLRLGAGLFLASDVMLALRIFVVTDPARRRALALLLWPAYWAGQALIAYGALLLLPPAG